VFALSLVHYTSGERFTRSAVAWVALLVEFQLSIINYNANQGVRDFFSGALFALALNPRQTLAKHSGEETGSALKGAKARASQHSRDDLGS
jgi:hypothetical protein